MKIEISITPNNSLVSTNSYLSYLHRTQLIFCSGAQAVQSWSASHATQSLPTNCRSLASDGSISASITLRMLLLPSWRNAIIYCSHAVIAGSVYLITRRLICLTRYFLFRKLVSNHFLGFMLDTASLTGVPSAIDLDNNIVKIPQSFEFVCCGVSVQSTAFHSEIHVFIFPKAAAAWTRKNSAAKRLNLVLWLMPTGIHYEDELLSPHNSPEHSMASSALCISI